LAIEAARAIGEEIFKKTPVGESISTRDRFDRDAVRATIRSTDDFEAKKKLEAKRAQLRIEESCEALRRLHQAIVDRTDDEPLLRMALELAIAAAGPDGCALVVKALDLKARAGEEAAALSQRFDGSILPEMEALVYTVMAAKNMKWQGLEAPEYAALAAPFAKEIIGDETAPAEEPKKKGVVRAVVTDAIRDEVKKLVESGRTGAEIAKQCGISLATVEDCQAVLRLLNSQSNGFKKETEAA
jgi:hypothetical protein